MAKRKVKNEKYLPIEDYGIIGNLHTVALVSLNASLDFMCFPRFDSPSLFCKLLDSEKGGSFSIDPEIEDKVAKQLYLPDTNVLLTRFFSEEGIAEIIDFMPVIDNHYHSVLVRKVATIRGRISYQVRCAPRFNYAASNHSVIKTNEGLLFKPTAAANQPAFVLRSTAELSVEGQDAVSNFTLNEGESGIFILQSEQEDEVENLQQYFDFTYFKTIDFWQGWISKINYTGHWQEMVRRSALTLKLLICGSTGSMVAAPTFSLPESIGHGRNWDYRYTWIRDAAFAMHAFLQLGFVEEAEHFLQWVKAQSTRQELQLMFSVDGKTDLQESTLDYLVGYKHSKPVRIGNDAHRQLQMDIYGELLETIFIFVRHGGDITYEYWKIIVSYIDLVIHNHQQPDHSIWEVRGKKRSFLFSKMMCWVAIDRAIKIGDHFSFPYDFINWKKIRNQLYHDMMERFWSDERQSFVQYEGGTSVDASTLLMPILNVISPHSEKWKLTMQAIDKDLRSDVLIYRYLEEGKEIDGLKGIEGTFTICSFWHIECLALQGDTQKAKEHFEKMMGYANHLGLYAEQIGMKGEHLGNFPQAFTHLALISAAIELNNAITPKTPMIQKISKTQK